MAKPLFQPIRPGGGIFQSGGGQSIFSLRNSLMTRGATPDQIEEAEAEVAAESTPFFFRALDFLEGLTGGQTVKGLLAGTGEEGIGDNLAEGFLKNPLFQLTDAIGITDLTGEKTRFTDVREHLFGEDPAEIKEGLGNLAFNVAGEIITDPGSFILPFGITPKGVAAAKAGIVSASTVKAVEAGHRAMAVFKVPFVEARWVAPSFKSMDLTIAHSLEGVANFLHTNALTAPVFEAFSPNHLRAGTVRVPGEFTLGERLAGGDLTRIDKIGGEEVLKGTTGAEFRQEFRRARQAGIEAARNVERRALPGLMSFAVKYPAFAKSGTRLGHAVTAIAESGVVSDFVTGEGKIAAGLELVDAKGALVNAAGIGGWNRRAVARAEKAAKDQGISELYAKARANDPAAVREIYTKHADLALPENILKHPQNLLELRDGTDMRSVREMTRNRDLAEVLDSPAALTERMASTADNELIVALETGNKAVVDKEGARLQALVEELFTEAGKRGGDAAEMAVVEELLGGAADIRKLMTDLGDAEISAGVLNDLMEPYFPHVLTEDMKRLANGRLKAVIDTQVKGGAPTLARVLPFMTGRKFTDLNIFEIDAVARELGVAAFGRVALKQFEKSPKTGVQWVMSRIFDAEFIRGFKKTHLDDALGLNGEEGVKAFNAGVQLFEANPMLAMYERMEQSMKAMNSQALNNELLRPESLFVDASGKAGDETYRKILANRPSHRVIFKNQKGQALVPNAARALKAGLDSDDKAAAYVATQSVYNEVLERVRLDPDSYTDNMVRLNDHGKLTVKSDPKKLVDIDLDTREERMLKVFIRDYQRRTANLGSLKGKALEKETIALKNLKDINISSHQIAARDAAGKLKNSLDKYFESVSAGKPKELTKGSPLIQKLSAASRDEVAARAASELRAGTLGDRLQLFLHEQENGFTALDEVEKNFPEMVQSLQGKDYVAVKSELYEAIWGADGAVKYMQSPDKLGYAARGFDKWTRWWKGWTVLPWPQSRSRDAVTNMLLLNQSGIGPRALSKGMGASHEITRAWRAAKAGDEGAIAALAAKKVEGLTTTLPNGTTRPTTYEDIFEEVQTKIGIGTSMAMDEMQLMASNRVALLTKREEGTMPFIRDMLKIGPDGMMSNPGFRASMTVADYGDSMPKIMGYMARRFSGETADVAAANVRAWTYSPDNMLTAFERHYVGRLAPFYRWFKFALGAETRALATRPGTVSFWEKVYRSSHEAVGLSPQELDAVMPEWISDRMGIPTFKTDKGVEYLLMGSWVPHGELNEVANTFGKLLDPENEDTLANFIGSRLNPVFKTAIENFRNRSFFTERPVEPFPGAGTEFVGINMSRTTANWYRNIRVLSELDRLKLFSPSETDTVVGASKPGDDRPLAVRLAESAISIAPRIREVEVGRQAGFEEIELKREGAKRKGQLKKGLRDKRPEDELQTLIFRIAKNEAEQKRLDLLKRKFPE